MTRPRHRLARVLPFVLLLAAPAPIAAQDGLDDARLDAAIRTGARYKNGRKYFEAATKDEKCKWAGAMSIDGIKKEVVFLGADELVAGAAAQSHAELRPFGLAEARALAVPDVVYAVVTMTARGAIGRDKLAQRYAGGIHLVLDLEGTIVQPVGKDAATVGPEGPQATLYHWYTAGGITWLNGLPLGAEQFQQAFVFPVSPATVPNDVRVVAVDGEGDRKTLTCSMRGLRPWGGP